MDDLQPRDESTADEDEDDFGGLQSVLVGTIVGVLSLPSGLLLCYADGHTLLLGAEDDMVTFKVEDIPIC